LLTSESPSVCMVSLRDRYPSWTLLVGGTKFSVSKLYPDNPCF
jgi:hypothetical protein